MGIEDVIKRFSPLAFIPTFLGIFVSYVIAPKLGITEPIQITGVTVLVAFIIWIISSLILLPIAEVEFIDIMNSLVLDRRYLKYRADDLKFNVKPSVKVKYVIKIFKMFKIDTSRFFLQIHWTPTQAFQFKPNEDYNTLSDRCGYPSICLDKFNAGQVSNYSLKFSCTPQYKETRSTKIRAKFIADPENSRSKLLTVFFLNIKSGEKEVKIKNNN